VAKACELLGFSPEVELEDGLRRTYEWYAGELRREEVPT
jgi:nucleoside-diphosphate-sugar epimerase